MFNHYRDIWASGEVPGDRVELSLMSPKSAKHIFKQALFL